MRRFAPALAAGALAAFAASAAMADDTIGSGETHYGTLPATAKARFNVLPPKDMSADEVQARIAAPPVASEPYWSTSFKDPKTGVTYKNIFMLGLNPMLKASNESVVAKVVLIPVIITMGETVFDPTKANSCQPKGSALTLTEKSPLFADVALTVGTVNLGQGIAGGKAQYPSLFQRGNFHKYIKSTTPKYNLVLEGSATQPLKVTVKGGKVFTAQCGKFGVFDQATWDNYARSVIQNKANAKILPPDTFPFFLFYNVVLDENNEPTNCCILGYHSSLANNGAFQAYGVGDFDSSKDFSGTSDISALSHEFDEWQDDPTGTNPTPVWGHIGQVAGCQNNLEVGDPLSGNIDPITVNGFTYHVQDLVFVDWFYDIKPSIGSNGWYSLFGSVVKTTNKPIETFSFKTSFAIEPCQ